MIKNLKKRSSLGNAVGKKLKSNSGESIAETLVAVLISAFALLMLAGTVNTASNLITTGQKNLEDYYAANNILAAHSPASSTKLTLTVTDSKNSANVLAVDRNVPFYTPDTDGRTTNFGNTLIAYGK